MTKSGFDLDEIERLLAAATPGEWVHYNEVFRPTLSKRRVTEIQSARTGKAIINWQGFDGDQARKANWNAALIVALHNSAPAMIAAIRELRATVATLGDSARAGANVLDAKDTEITRLRAALRQIQDEGDAHSNAIATATLGGSDEQNPA